MLWIQLFTLMRIRIRIHILVKLCRYKKLNFNTKYILVLVIGHKIFLRRDKKLFARLEIMFIC